MQGTITNSSFSDEFWLELLPQEYSKKYNISLESAKKQMKKMFNSYGKYDYRYYSVKYWENELNFNFKELIENKKVQLVVESELINLARKYPSIVITTTTSEFIDLELSNKEKIFKRIYSSIDTFGIAGKTKEVYERAGQDQNINPNEILHVGDNYEMDYENAIAAGYRSYYFDKNKDIKIIINEIEKMVMEE